MTKLYIAYGSNLNKRQMRQRCPTARPLGKFYLTDAKLVFRGAADVEYSPGDKVPCALWSINQADELALDRYEGPGYYKETGVVIQYCGRPRNTLMYLMRSSDGIMPPSQHYADVIRRGYEDFGLDQKYLDAAIKHSWEEKSPDNEARSRRARQKESVLHKQLVKMPESVALRRLDIRRAAQTERKPEEPLQ
jgi:AIG2-like family